MLSIKTKFWLIVTAEHVFNQLGIALSFYIKLANFLDYQMTVTIFCIMKYYRNIFSKFKTNITLCSNEQNHYFPCYMIMISYFIFSCNKQFITYPAFNCFNKFIDCILLSVKNNWSPKFIINTYNFASKTARNLFWYFLV